ncbi:MAG: heme-binding protein [Planctomycetales bacterium]
MWKLSACLLVVSVGAAVLWRASSLGAGELAKHSYLDSNEVKSAVEHLESASESSSMDTAIARMEKAIETLGNEHFASQMILAAKTEGRTDVKKLRKDVDRVIESLTFRPWMEAELPEGFPEFTPVHHIEVKTLPEYRMARASMRSTQRSRENGAFWKLFSHIKRNDIAMTAPVQMDYTTSDAEAEVASMAFLYGSRKIGESGSDDADDSVEVLDIPRQDVVAIGVRGRMTAESVKQGHLALLEWLKTRKSEYRPTGPLRRMGYNRPFISEERAFFELQSPVKKTAKKTAAGEIKNLDS